MSACPSRSPGSRIVLLPAPSQPRGQWLSRVSSPITVTGSRRIHTAFPGALSGPGREQRANGSRRAGLPQSGEPVGEDPAVLLAPAGLGDAVVWLGDDDVGQRVGGREGRPVVGDHLV